MNPQKLLLVIAAAMVGLPSAMAQPATMAAPQVPANLRVPDGHVLYLKAHAQGTQNYICTPGAGGAAWKLFGPQATLFISFPWLRGEVIQQIATHYPSANPSEGGLARPTWQHSFDTSAVWGKAVASSTDPAFVEQGAIAWLLLEAAGTRRGPMGGMALSQTTYIQRVNTSGGSAPGTGCDDSLHGATVMVPYQTDYLFYQAERRN